MNESELRARFETLTLRPDEFTHREHVRLAWIYLREHPLLDVLRIFPENLKRFASSIGASGLYHETITWAYLMVIAERMAEADAAQAWETFIERNGDLLQRGFLERFYDVAALQSDEARRRFLFPRGTR